MENLGFEITDEWIEKNPREIKQGKIILKDLNFPIQKTLALNMMLLQILVITSTHLMS